MNQDLDYMISVMQAAKEGKKIQIKHSQSSSWSIGDAGCYFRWNWNEFDYRVKPEQVEPRRIALSYGPTGEFQQGCWQNVPSVDECIKTGLVLFIEVTPEVRQKLSL